MITRQTLFILGAGASCTFGYPLGKNLVDIILNNFNPSYKDNAINLFTGLGFSEEEIINFHNELRLSATPSIDTFLEPRHEEERYLGKLAIAYALIPFEKTETLFYDNSWYKTFINKLQPKFEDFDKNKIAFITFNYDRSLEHFLYMALMNRFKESVKEVVEKIEKIPIVHLYGRLGFLPWEKKGSNDYSRDYNPNITPHILRKSSSSLKIIFDKLSPDDEDFKKAKILIRTSRKVYFLGFGFHRDNMERLNFRTIYTTLSSPPTLEATSYKLPIDLKESIPKLYRVKFPNHDWDVNEFLEQRLRNE